MMRVFIHASIHIHVYNVSDIHNTFENVSETHNVSANDAREVSGCEYYLRLHHSRCDRVRGSNGISSCPCFALALSCQSIAVLLEFFLMSSGLGRFDCKFYHPSTLQCPMQSDGRLKCPWLLPGRIAHASINPLIIDKMVRTTRSLIIT